jgi:hypothetical protein
MKKRLNNPELVADSPEEFLKFMEHLQSLRYGDRPDYKYLHTLLASLFHRLNGDESTPFDWETIPMRKTKRPRPLPSLVDLCFIRVASNIEQYNTRQVTGTLLPAIKKKMLDFLIRINNGRLPRAVLDRLLDEQLEELDLISCEFNEADYHQLATTCTKLRRLTLGATTDGIVKVV